MNARSRCSVGRPASALAFGRLPRAAARRTIALGALLSLRRRALEPLGRAFVCRGGGGQPARGRGDAQHRRNEAIVAVNRHGVDGVGVAVADESETPALARQRGPVVDHRGTPHGTGHLGDVGKLASDEQTVVEPREAQDRLPRRGLDDQLAVHEEQRRLRQSASAATLRRASGQETEGVVLAHRDVRVKDHSGDL
jgi:hypothetical protein